MRVEVFFEDDSPADAAKIQLRQGDAVIVEGRADETGIWKTILPPAGEYELRAEHTGHVATELLTIVGEAAGDGVAPAPKREELVGVRWTRIGIGLGVLTGGWWAVRFVGQRRRRMRRPT